MAAPLCRRLPQQLLPLCQTAALQRMSTSTVLNQSIPSDDEVAKEGISKTFINRNPRNLEFMGIAHKRKGWKFQAPRKDFYYQLSLEREGKHTTAQLMHWSGAAVVTATTKEAAISKHLESTANIAAAQTIGNIIGRRCLQAGFERMLLRDGQVGPAAEAFRKAVLESGIVLSEPEEDSRGPEEFGTDYDKLVELKELRNQQYRERVALSTRDTENHLTHRS